MDRSLPTAAEEIDNPGHAGDDILPRLHDTGIFYAGVTMPWAYLGE